MPSGVMGWPPGSWFWFDCRMLWPWARETKPFWREEERTRGRNISPPKNEKGTVILWAKKIFAVPTGVHLVLSFSSTPADPACEGRVKGVIQMEPKCLSGCAVCEDGELHWIKPMEFACPRKIYSSSPGIGLRFGTLANIFLKSSFLALLALSFK